MTGRMRGGAFLDVDVLEEREADTTAPGQTTGAVAIVAVARAIGAAGF